MILAYTLYVGAYGVQSRTVKLGVFNMKKSTLAALAPYQTVRANQHQTFQTNAYMFALLVLLTFLLLPFQSFAAIDVTGALAGFGEVNTAVPLVGAAFLLALGILAAWKLIRGAFA